MSVICNAGSPCNFAQWGPQNVGLVFNQEKWLIRKRESLQLWSLQGLRAPAGTPRIFSSGSKAPRSPPQSVRPPPRGTARLPHVTGCFCCFLAWKGRTRMVPLSYSCSRGLKGWMMESTKYLALSTQHSTDASYSHFCRCSCPWAS